METIVLNIDYFRVPMGFDTPDFNTNMCIYSDGTFKTDGKFSEVSTLRSWLYEVSPNGTDCLTIIVRSNLAQYFDKSGPEVKGVVAFLEKNLSHIRTTNKDFRYTPGV